MMQKKSFKFQVFILAMFLIFFFIFFAYTTSIYRNYKIETKIQGFEDEIDNTEEIVNSHPSELLYRQSSAFKDRFYKENLNVLKPGEISIVLPGSDQKVEQGPVQLMTEELSPDSVLNKPNYQQWKAYFFGPTLSVQMPKEKSLPLPIFEPEEDIIINEPLEG